MFNQRLIGGYWFGGPMFSLDDNLLLFYEFFDVVGNNIFFISGLHTDSTKQAKGSTHSIGNGNLDYTVVQRWENCNKSRAVTLIRRQTAEILPRPKMSH